MDLVSRLDGYLNHEIMHSNPIPVLPPSKTIKYKKDTTLLDMALKALLKERMYGNLQNFHTQNIENKNHLRIRSNSINQKTKQILSIDQASVNTNLSNTKSKKITFFQRKNDTNNQTKNSSAKKHLSQISSSMDFYMKKTNQRKFRLISQKKVRFADENLTTDVKNSENQYIGTHFISAIDLLPTQKTINLTSIKQIQTDFKLPEISDKRKIKSSKLQNTKISKALFKQNGLRITVKQQFWTFLCNKKDQRIRRNKQPNIIRNESYKDSPLEESINLSTGKKSVNYQNSNYPNVIESKKQISKYNQYLVFKREIFLSFIGNEKFTVPSFISGIFSFFQLASKFIDRASKIQFESIFNELFNQSDRAWCFAIFQFLDPNLNAKIDSSDLFKVYNIIDSSKNLVQESLDQFRILSLKENIQQINEPSTQKTLKFKRQKTVASQNGSTTQRSIQKKSMRVLIQSSVKQKAVDSQQNVQTQINFMKNNLENIISLLRQIQRLNQKIILKNSSFASQNMSQNPQSNSSNKYKSFYEKLYLQRGLLDKKDVKITDLTSILQQNSAQKKIKNKKVLDIDHKKINVKLSSGYVQTFIATNHNEETRINREFLQNLKDKVKKMTEVRNFSDSKDRQNHSNGIQYAQFYEEKLFLPFKKLFFGLIQIIILSK